MPLLTSELASLPWPVLLVGTWLFTVVVIAAVIYRIAKAAINKTDARDLPNVLIALAPLLTGTARSLTRLPGPAVTQLPTDPAASPAPIPQNVEQAPGSGGQTQ
ncbi:hypothetical protein [Actinomadura sp. WAC 06369]|uniref:hypothetical protein n=1 Tax=Actinomadura sp. WAC 06369 TaxID=2203193 RepID=UPI000F7AD301|nr:hypothetical protein [Actinomadura sp. WAC 06369]RSN48286.1 hypothetical protein DMH08_34500 [Actinomadura sp. WAC 06369]